MLCPQKGDVKMSERLTGRTCERSSFTSSSEAEAVREDTVKARPSAATDIPTLQNSS